ncbi:MAG: AEC family transporter, partial [Hydrogenophilaceae bacterium]|nr:AEC family transporter [Hydrogenophilaceae bacterium]
VLSVVAVKLAVMPLIVFGLIAATGQGSAGDGLSEQQRAAIIEAGMPAMTTSVLLADRFHLDTETVALLLGWSTLLFALLLPGWVWLFS